MDVGGDIPPDDGVIMASEEESSASDTECRVLCQNPFKRGPVEHGCGQCMPCRLNKRRTWTARLLLETTQHASTMWVTLTYNDENLPEDRCVYPKVLSAFMKRLRNHVGNGIRFYGVGEYGEISQRPHYHVAIFGARDPEAVSKSWRMGHTKCAFVSAQSMSYQCSHLTKNAHRFNEQGLAPEFARMSLRPHGLGYDALDEMARWHLGREGSEYIARTGDVCKVFRFNGSKYPLGQYLTRKLRYKVGIGEGQSSTAAKLVSQQRAAEVEEKGFQFFAEKRIQDGYISSQKFKGSERRKSL